MRSINFSASILSRNFVCMDEYSYLWQQSSLVNTALPYVAVYTMPYDVVRTMSYVTVRWHTKIIILGWLWKKVTSSFFKRLPSRFLSDLIPKWWFQWIPWPLRRMSRHQNYHPRLNAKKSYDQVHKKAAILDAILNFSKCSRVTKVHSADSENGPPRLPKTIKKNLVRHFQVHPTSAGLYGVWTGL